MSSPSPSQCSFSSQSSFYSDDDQGMYFDDLYDISVFLYRGQFGETYRCLEKETGSKYAVKVLPPVDKNTETEGKYSSFNVKYSREGAIWRRMKHRNIVELYRVFTSQREQFLVIEYLKDGKLFDQIPHLSLYTEREICYFTKQLLEAISYLRSKRVIHRNITPESILIKQTEHGDTIKLCDFSLALRLQRGQKHIKTEPKGVPLYLSPETILEKPINYCVDTWSVGVILYILVVGSSPFWSERSDVLYAEILNRPPAFLSHSWNSVSIEAKELLESLLDKGADTRITSDDALNHAWFNEHSIAPEEHRQTSIDKLKEFNARRKSHGNIFTVQSVFPGEKGQSIKDVNNNDTGIINSFGEMRRKKMYDKERRQSEQHHNPDGRKMTVMSKTKTINFSKQTSKSKVCIQFQPKKVMVHLNTNYKV